MIDYENIRDNFSRRYLGFGRFAGIVGCYNSLNLFLENSGETNMPRAYELNSYDKIKNLINNKIFKDTRIILTGDGRVAKGAMEFLESTNIKKITPEEYLKNENKSEVFCNLPTAKYVRNKDNKDFDLQHFINFPDQYNSVIDKYLVSSNMLISAHYWDPKSPKLFEKNDIIKYKKLKVIGDITCDLNGSVPTTIKATTIQNPYFYINPVNFKEVKKNNNSLSIMSVDNLPSELPRDSSLEFGSGIVKEVLPFILNQDDGRIEKATIASNGDFLPKYSYIKNYINH